MTREIKARARKKAASLEAERPRAQSSRAGHRDLAGKILAQLSIMAMASASLIYLLPNAKPALLRLLDRRLALRRRADKL